MKQITTIGLDLAKQVFQVHAASADGSPVFNRKLRRAEVLRFFEKTPACLVGMEACGSAHYWAREIRALGHDVRLIPPVYVKPFVKRGKTDAADAEAISEAVTRKTMRFVPVKSADQQAAAVVLKTSCPSGQPAHAGDQRAAWPPVGVRHHCRRRDGEDCRVDLDRARQDGRASSEGCPSCADGSRQPDRRVEGADRETRAGDRRDRQA